MTTADTIQRRWSAYPMGPTLRRFIGLSTSAYGGETAADPSDDQKSGFSDDLVAYAAENPVDSETTLVGLLDELVAMDLPQAALGLKKANDQLWTGRDFRGELALGVANMLEGHLDEAVTHFRAAHGLLPDEPAPYVNIVSILRYQGRLDDALSWSLAGLDVEPNNLRLWDFVGVIYRDLHGEAIYGEKLLELAQERNAWAGLSLAADVTAGGDHQHKAALLEPLYYQGVHEPAFLVELTAAMGVAGDYKKIPSVVAQAEQSAPDQVPWQLQLHCAQAHLALEQTEPAKARLEKAKKSPDLPDEAWDAVRSLEAEAAETAES